MKLSRGKPLGIKVEFAEAINTLLQAAEYREGE